MKKIIWILICIFSIHSQISLAENIVDKLIVALVDKKLPIILYQHKDKPWEMGIYSLTVNKVGGAGFSSTKKQLKLTIPLEVVINGKIKKNILGARITIGCNSRVVTDGKLNIVPEIKPTGTDAEVSIFIPIPKSQLNCDGIKIPIKQLLEKLVADNKAEWEKSLESDIHNLFQQVGI